MFDRVLNTSLEVWVGRLYSQHALQKHNYDVYKRRVSTERKLTWCVKTLYGTKRQKA